MQGYKTKYLCSGLPKFFKKLLAEKSDQKQVSPIKNNFKISFVLIKQKIKEEMFKGNKQYPNKQNIWKMLILTPNKLLLRNTRKLPTQKIRKIKITVWLLSFEFIANVHAKKTVNNNGPHKSHCLICFFLTSSDVNGLITNISLIYTEYKSRYIVVIIASSKLSF